MDDLIVQFVFKNWNTLVKNMLAFKRHSSKKKKKRKNLVLGDIRYIAAGQSEQWFLYDRPMGSRSRPTPIPPVPAHFKARPSFSSTMLIPSSGPALEGEKKKRLQTVPLFSCLIS